MTTASPELYTYREGDEERIIGLLQEHGEDGISAFAMCAGLNIKFQPLNAILERLQRNGQARMVRRKSGAIYWYPDDHPPAAPIPQQIETPAPPAAQDPTQEDEGRVPCPVEGCRSTIKRKHKSVYTHLYGLHGLRGDKLHARLDEILGADRLRRTPIGETASRPCPFPKCTSSFTGRHARASVINHMIQRHEVDREGAKLIADGKQAPPVVDMGTEPEEVSIKPISVPITECECRKPIPVEDAPSLPAETITELAAMPDCTDGSCTIGYELMPRPAPGPRDIPNTCTPIDVRQVTIRTTERPEDEPTPLARICSLAVEMEALAARHGYVARVDIDAYHERPKMQIEVCPKGVSE